MNKAACYILILALATTVKASTEVSGQVKDYADQNPIANAKVTEETESKSVFADLNGLYSIIIGNQAPVLDSNLVLEGSVGDSLEKNLRNYFSDDKPDSLLSFILTGNDGFSYSITQDDILKVELEQEGTDNFKVVVRDAEGDSAVMNTYADIQPNGGITEEEAKNIKLYSNNKGSLVLEDKNRYEITISFYDIAGRTVGKMTKEENEIKTSLSVSAFPQGKYLLNLKKGNEVIGKGKFVVLNGTAITPNLKLVTTNNNKTSNKENSGKESLRGAEKDTLYLNFGDTTGAHFPSKFNHIINLGENNNLDRVLLPSDNSKFNNDNFTNLVGISEYFGSERIHDTLSSHIVYLIDDFDMSDEMVGWAVKSHKSTTTHQAICDYFTKGIFNEDTYIDTITGHHALPYGPDTFLIMTDNTIPGNGTFDNVVDENNYIVGGWVKVRGNATKKDVELESLGNLGYKHNLDDSTSYFDPGSSVLVPTKRDSLYIFLYFRPANLHEPDSIPPISAILTEREVS